jgi:hypothetical protein
MTPKINEIIDREKQQIKVLKVLSVFLEKNIVEQKQQLFDFVKQQKIFYLTIKAAIERPGSRALGETKQQGLCYICSSLNDRKGRPNTFQLQVQQLYKRRHGPLSS